MKKKIILLSALFCFGVFGFSQTAEGQLYYFQQYENTETALKTYLSDILYANKINPEGIDNIYLNIIPPMSCPRCEGIVVEYNKTLQQQSAGKDFIINVVAYSKPAALDQYIAHQHFSGNILFRDSTKTLLSIFNTMNGAFAVPYITKVSLKSGRLISEYSVLGIEMSSDLVQAIRAKQDFLPLVQRNNNQTTNEENQPINIAVYADSWQDAWNSRYINLPVDSFAVKDADKIPYNYEFLLDKNARSLILSNFLNASFSLYSLNNKKIFVKKTDFIPTKAEDKMFVSKEISSEIYDYLLSINLPVSMYLNADFTGDNVYIMSSLPKIFIITGSDSVASLGYANQAVCLIKTKSGDLVRTILLDSIQIPEQYDFDHTVGVIFTKENTMAFRLKKGWPAGGTTSVPPSDERNPFLTDFYKNTNSVLFYNLANKQVNVTSPIDSLYAKYKLGYFFSSPIEKNLNGTFYWTDKYMGKIYKLSQDLKKQTLICDLFDMKNTLQQMPYAENLEYIESYSKYFSRQILDFNISPKGLITALVSDKTHFYFYEINKKGEINISAFPDYWNTATITTLHFGENINNQQTVYALYQNNQKMIIYKFLF